MTSPVSISLVAELLPELLEQYPGAWRITDRHGLELGASSNIDATKDGIWREWTRPLTGGRSVTWFIKYAA